MAGETQAVGIEEVLSLYANGQRRFDGLLVSQSSAHTGIQLSGAEFERCTFVDLDLNIQHAPARFLECIFRGCKLSSSQFVGTAFTSTTFHSCTIESVNYEGATIRECRFELSRCTNSNFHATSLQGVTFVDCPLQGITLAPKDVNAVRILRCQVQSATFRDLKSGSFAFEACGSLSSSRFEMCAFTGATMRSQDVSSVTFSRCSFAEADVSGANISGTTFESCDLQLCNLLRVRADAATRFLRCEVSGARIERHTLELLNDYGELTRGQRMTLDVTDGALLLRRSYTGFWQWLHVLALILFLWPYLILVIREGLRSGPSCPTGAACSTILNRLGEAVVTGGKMDGSISALALVLFGFMLAYNIIRATLLYKAKSLELQEAASGVPVVFRWEGLWKKLYTAAHLGFFVNVAVAVVHTLLFLHRSVVVT